MAVTSNRHLAPVVGETVVLQATVMYPQAPAVGAQWTLDPSDVHRANLMPSADGTSCQVLVQQPGAIRVTVSRGSIAAHAILAATTAPPPGKLVEVPGVHGGESYYGPFAFNNVPVIVTSEAEWRRYWQGVAAYTAKGSIGGGDFTVPALPAVDLATSSLVVIGTTFGDYHPLPVLTRVDPGGEGLVEVDMPDEENRVPGHATVARSLQVYQVAKLPATTRLVFDCRAESVCFPARPLPSPAPFAAIAAQTLVVGQAVDLPTQGQGVPLTWALAPRTAERASLDGNHLVPKVPGALVLTVTDGTEAATVVDAVAASADQERFSNIQLRTTIENGPRVLRTQQEWNDLWTTTFYPPGTGANQPWTAPPPPPPAPSVDFPARNLLLVTLSSGAKPVIAGNDGTTITMVVPGVVRGGHFAPAGAGGGPTYIFDIPAIAGTPTVTVEAVPEATP
jgi:hypothetical protein